MGGIRRIVYIASVTHGGSTLLDMLLSAHPGICGVGEVARLIDPTVRARLLARRKPRLCSCGRVVTPEPDCPLWAPWLAGLAERAEPSVAHGYATLLARVSELEPGVSVVSDSSKSLRRLRQLERALAEPDLAGVELRVIHLVRDVRSFVASRRARYRDSTLASFRRFGEWYRTNRRIADHLARSERPWLRIGYEDLCLHPHAVLPRVCAFLDLEPDPAMADLARSRGHVGIGNPMRMDADRARTIQYDDRWFRDDVAALFHLLRPRIRRANREWVYGGRRALGRRRPGGDAAPEASAR